MTSLLIRKRLAVTAITIMQATAKSEGVGSYIKVSSTAFTRTSLLILKPAKFKRHRSIGLCGPPPEGGRVEYWGGLGRAHIQLDGIDGTHTGTPHSATCV